MTYGKKSLGPSFLGAFFGLILLLLLMGAGRPLLCFCQDLPSETNKGLKPYCLVIDSGHGGKDSGVAIVADWPEKNLTLDIAQKISELISPDTGIKAILTRSGDFDLPLENRAAIANHEKADLFLSIHFSKHLYPATEELRIFTADYSSLEEKEYFSVASENWQSMQSRYLIESRELAQDIEKAAHQSGSFESVNFLEAPVYVLEGASMPAVEVEVGIASTQENINKIESEEYRWQIARVLFQGILDYMKERRQTP